MDSKRNIATILKQLLTQQIILLKQISKNTYQEKIPTMDFACIGGHCRHIIEFIDQLVKNYDAGIISYDDRQRDLTLENRPEFAIQKTIELSQSIMNLEEKPLQLKQLYGDHRFLINTSLERELSYNIEHTIHHQALIKVALNYLELGHLVSPDFGVAPSTLHYRTNN